MNDKIKSALSSAMLKGAGKVIAAVDFGPRATADALDAFIRELMLVRDTVDLISVIAGGCGDPDCPNCGKAREPVSGPAVPVEEHPN